MTNKSLTEMYFMFHESLDSIKHKSIDQFPIEYQGYAAIHQKFMLVLEAEAQALGISWEVAKEAYVIQILKHNFGEINQSEYDELMNLIANKYREDNQVSTSATNDDFIRVLNELMIRYGKLVN
ncbi:hypothetical protein FJR11_19540 [Anabaena sp. UHCC 0187]|uniref:hypothetical protein n=1 Tax=Anabaena sp. UHCC 0187 TaxID=2590018 RepID=UPI001446AC0F|nr:hypothetical protein [Anabaena sp. UHCC 0187]MTJ14731.1 hypothetical protein [Anabaena sp. UHCC 0187]